MKYIVTITDKGLKEIFLFSRSINHKSMMLKVQIIRDPMKTQIDFRQPYSAGFIDETGECYGRSESLDIESKLFEDTTLLKRSYEQ